MSNIRIESAIQLAAEAHQGMSDKAGQPYIFHLLRVMMRLEREKEQIVAVLHDIVEDTTHTLDDLRKMGYQEDIVEAIDYLTKRDDGKETDYDQYIDRVSKNPLATQVKIADLEDNMNVQRLPEPTREDMDRTAKYYRVWSKLKGRS